MKKLSYIKPLSRLNSVQYILNYSIEWYLNKLALGYLAQGKKQIVEYSFNQQSRSINLHGVYEIKELSTLIDWLKIYSPSVFDGEVIDIGANIGNHSIFFSQYFRRVYSFEPNHCTFEILKINAQLVDNMTCYEEGLSEIDGEAFLTDPVGFPGCCEIADSTQNNLSIQIKKLDSVSDRFQDVRLIKVDIEGHELKAFLGGEQFIRQNKPFILFEQHPNEFDSNGTSKVIELLKSFGYSKFATVLEYPRIKKSANKTLWYAFTTLSRVLCGSEMRVEFNDVFLPEFYPFIIAIPNQK